MGSTERFLVSGVTTAIGAWVAKQLISEGVEVVALGDTVDDHRLRLICAPTELLALGKIDADLDDVESVTDAMGATTHVIHFDATTEEDCDADPRTAAHESLLRAVTMFESARRAGVQRLAFQSGMSVFSQESGEVTASSPHCPSSLRGAMHVATEQMADHYRRNTTLDVVAVRPNLVYGPGVDRGARRRRRGPSLPRSSGVRTASSMAAWSTSSSSLTWRRRSSPRRAPTVRRWAQGEPGSISSAIESRSLGF